MARKLSSIRQTIAQLLRDEFKPDEDSDWEQDEIDIHIWSCLYEVTEASRFRARELLTVVENSKLLDISGIADLIEVRCVEYPPGADPRNRHNIERLDNETIEISIDSAPAETTTSGTLTGTVTFTSGSPTVSGSGTDFDGELEEGYFIKPSTKSRWYRIASIESDTELTLEEAVKSGDAGADDQDATQYRDEYVAIAHCDRLHTLTEQESSLNPLEEQALILGVCGHAAISKARSLINRVPTGGGSTPADMQNWGLTKLTLYQRALKRLRPPESKKRYPTS